MSAEALRLLVEGSGRLREREREALFERLLPCFDGRSSSSVEPWLLEQSRI